MINITTNSHSMYSEYVATLLPWAAVAVCFEKMRPDLFGRQILIANQTLVCSLALIAPAEQDRVVEVGFHRRLSGVEAFALWALVFVREPHWLILLSRRIWLILLLLKTPARISSHVTLLMLQLLLPAQMLSAKLAEPHIAPALSGLAEHLVAPKGPFNDRLAFGAPFSSASQVIEFGQRVLLREVLNWLLLFAGFVWML